MTFSPDFFLSDVDCTVSMLFWCLAVVRIYENELNCLRFNLEKMQLLLIVQGIQRGELTNVLTALSLGTIYPILAKMFAMLIVDCS